MANNELTFPTKTIAKLLDLTEARIGQLWKDGVISKPLERGRYPSDAIPQYIKWLRNKAFGTDIATGDTNKERARLLKNQADEKEMIVAEMRGELISATLVDAESDKAVLAIRNKLLGLPNKIAPLVLSSMDIPEVESAVRNMIYDVLDDLAEMGDHL